MEHLTNLLKQGDIDSMDEVTYVHQFNSNAVRHTRSIGDVLGLSQVGVHLVRVEPGHDSTQFHFHHRDEEFIYVLSGTGIAEIGEEQVQIAAGDFMGFPRNSPAHNLYNDSEADLVYLVGGTREAVDICDYPRISRRMYRIDGARQAVDIEHLENVEKTIR